MTTSFRLAAPLATLATALALSASAAPAKPKQAAPSAGGPAFAAMVAEDDQGHILGNPDASSKLVEFMSYTCSHCADFARTGDAAIRGFYLPRGKVNYEIRHLLRDPIDLTAALMTHCGTPAKFIGNHEALLRQQNDWLERARKSTQAQRTRWSFGTNGARFRAIASDLGFYAIMEDRGYTRPELDRCLADESKANAMAETSQRDIAAFNLQGTPSFVLDGELLDGVYSWDALAPVLDKVG